MHNCCYGDDAIAMMIVEEVGKDLAADPKIRVVAAQFALGFRELHADRGKLSTAWSFSLRRPKWRIWLLNLYGLIHYLACSAHATRLAELHASSFGC